MGVKVCMVVLHRVDLYGLQLNVGYLDAPWNVRYNHFNGYNGQA